MKKTKVLFLTLALMFTVGLTATGCDQINKIKGFFGKGDSSSTESSIEEGFSDTRETLAVVTFDKTEVSVYQYESISLVCDKKWTSEDIVYTSSDDSVASVDANGNVTAKDKVGQVKITATAGGASAVCVITVEKSPYHPQIILNSTNYTVEVGSTLEFAVATEWNKAELSENITYTATLAENSQNAKATVSVDGNIVKVVATDSVETLNIVVSANVRGLYTSEQLTVNVVQPQLKIMSGSAAFQPNNGVYVVDISTTDLVGDMANSVPMSFVAAKGVQTLNNVAIDWEILEGTAAVIQEGNLVGKEVGVVTLMGTAEYEGETASVQLLCNVIPPELTLDETIVLDLQEENLAFTLESKFIGTLKTAEYMGVKVSNRAKGQTVSFDATTFPTTASKLGRQELVLNTSLVRYTMPIEVYTMIINDKDELDQMRIIANTGEEEYSNRFGEMRNAQYYDGYFVLGNDIDYNKTITSMTDSGSVWNVQGFASDDRGFKGVFDGRGYNIDGVTVGNHPSGGKNEAGGIFGYIATGGVVKNVSFTNAVLQANNGFICCRGNGTVENVSVQYKKIGGDKETRNLNSATPLKMGTFFSLEASNKATVKNCLVDASAADITLELGSYNGFETMNINLVGVASNVENVIALCPDTRVLESSGADIKRLTYNDLIAESELMEGFDTTYWTTVDGIPMFVNQAEKLDRDFEVDFLNVKSSLVAGFSMLVLANNPYTRIELSPVEGVSFANSMLSATEEAFTKTVTLKVISLLNPENTKTIEVYIDSFGATVDAPTTEKTVVDYANPVLSIGDNSWMGEENYAYIGADVYSVGNGADGLVLNWKALGWEAQEITVVTVKNGVRTNFKTSVQIGYTPKNFVDSVKIADTAFGTPRQTQDGTYVLADAEADIAAPEGYENVNRIISMPNTNSATGEWWTALTREFFNDLDVSAYKDIWFGVKIVHGKFVIVQQSINTSAWVYFHYTQIDDGEWAVEITMEGGSYATIFNVKGNKVKDLLYRNGWENGFLLYNNNGMIPEGKQTSVYTTEIRGVLKDAQ